MDIYQIKLLVIFLLSLFSKCDSADPTCSPTIASVALSPPDLERIIRFTESQQIGPKLLDNTVVTGWQMLGDIRAYNQGAHNEDINLSITELIQKYGYECEEHTVETPDGYILTLHRVIGEGPVVFLMHGLLCSADDYVTAGPDDAAVYALAAAGYDVWLGNARGNKYSRKHKTLSPDCAEFWDFSWHEIGVYDLPTMIDHALNATGRTKLSYIGHSQGTTSFFVMASERPEYNEKISLMIALAPVAFMSRLKSLIPRILALNIGLEYTLLKAIGIDEILPNNLFLDALKKLACGENPLAELVCSNFLMMVSGFDYGNLNITNLPVVMAHVPAGSATKQVAHYGQEVESAKFRQFDYGETKNMEVYGGSKTPPDYGLDKVTAPVALFYSDCDYFANDTDVKILRDKLPNVVDFYFCKHFGHIDYIYGKNLKEVINKKILKLIKEHM